MIKNAMIYFKSNYKSIISFVLVLILEIFLENIIQRLFNDNAIQFSVSFIFIINLILYIYFKNKYVYLSFQLLLIITYVAILLPHMYFFNFFSFYARTNYIFLEPIKFATYLIITILSIFTIYYYSLLQIKLINKTKKKTPILFYILIIIIIKIIISPEVYTFNFNGYDQKITATIINQNKLTYYKVDYSVFKAGGSAIKNYECASSSNISPTIQFMYNTKSNKELLLIIESWGKLNNTKEQTKLLKYIEAVFNKNTHLYHNFTINFGETCFNGNTSAAEGRELLNMNDEESYRAFLNKGIKPQFNIVDYKNKNNYYTQSAFSGSKEYGSNWGNAEGFRRKIGFNSTFYYEDLKKINSINHENNYRAVNDEAMIDSLFIESTLHQKIFAYGLTINTHAPFELDKSKIDTNDYSLFKEKFNGEASATDQLYRIKMIIEYTFFKLAKTTNSFEEIIIIGDHSSPEFRSTIYNKEKVPFIFIKKGTFN